MDPKRPGRAIPVTLRAIGGAVVTVEAFVPEPLPPQNVNLMSLGTGLARAERALTALDRACDNLRGATVLLRAIRKREVQKSSEIENTFASLEEVSLLEAGRAVGREQAREVLNNLAAVEHALASSLPMCNRLLRESHAVLMAGVRGEELRPGEFRDGQVYIGNPQRGPGGVRYVPPPPEELGACLAEFELAMNPEDARFAGRVRLPWLVELAFLHYQFEAIHPFRDGNGRVGRLIVHVAPVKWGVLRHPVANISEALSRDRRRYYDGLLGVSARGDWTGWAEVFLAAAAAQAEDDLVRVRALVKVRERYIDAVRGQRHRGFAEKVADVVVSRAMVSVAQVMEGTGLARPNASRYVRMLVEAGLLEAVGERERGRVYRAAEVFRVLDAPVEQLV
jgi:Fic family protein